MSTKPLPHTKTLLFKLILLTLSCSIFYLVGFYRIPDHTPQTPFLDSPHCPKLHLAPSLDFLPHHLLSVPPQHPFLLDHQQSFHFCDTNFTDYCPCHDPSREKQFDMEKKFFKERHCPEKDERVRCLVPKPVGYRTPFRWPESRDFVWYSDVPFSKLVDSKKEQNWVRLEGDRFNFPGGGTTFRSGVKEYVNQIQKMVPLKSGNVRTVLDVGCGVASFGASLMDYNILTMSIAPRDTHEAQVQFALERGLPAVLGILSIHRLPYPSRSFDMAHCSRCLVPWTDYGGLYLMEIDRVLRPGGYWVISGPPINWKTYKGSHKDAKEMEKDYTTLEDLARQLCWKKIAEHNQIVVWKKPNNHIQCFKKSNVQVSRHLCDATDPDSGWYKKMDLCITPLPKVKHIKDISGGILEKWPKRLNAIPPRIRNKDISKSGIMSFNQDNQLWKRRVTHYEKFLKPLSQGKYRNIMDMNSGLGGFAAAMSTYQVWVMNVIPYDANNTLGIIYERGLIGTYMDWCEAFSTYPRTYDLIHADRIFSMYMNKCDIVDILLEMHRILRPEGAIIIRDHIDIIVKAKNIIEKMRWNSNIQHSERGHSSHEKILIVDNSNN